MGPIRTGRWTVGRSSCPASPARGQTTFELVGCLGAVIGVALATFWGYRLAGTPGAIGGGLLGAFAGMLAGAALVAVCFGMATWWERAAKRRHVRATFGRYWRADRADAWARVKDQLLPGSKIAGTVVFAPSYGSLVDIGCGFPARLPRTADGDDVVHPMLAPGSRVEALVLEFDDRDRDVVLTRHDRRWLVFEGTPVGYLLGDRPLVPGEPLHAFAVRNGAHGRLVTRLEAEGRARGEIRWEGTEPVAVEVSRAGHGFGLLGVSVMASAAAADTGEATS